MRFWEFVFFVTSVLLTATRGDGADDWPPDLKRKYPPASVAAPVNLVLDLADADPDRSNFVTSLAFSPRGDRLFAGLNDGRLFCLDARSGALLGTIQPPLRKTECAQVAFISVDRALVRYSSVKSSGKDALGFIDATRVGMISTAFPEEELRQIAVDLTRNVPLVCLGGREGRLLRLDSADEKFRLGPRLFEADESIVDVAVTPSREIAISTVGGGLILSNLADLESGRSRKYRVLKKSDRTWIGSIVFSQDYKRIVISGQKDRERLPFIEVFDMETAQPVQKHQLDALHFPIALRRAADGLRPAQVLFAIRTQPSHILAMEEPSMELSYVEGSSDPTRFAAISPDGRLLATSCDGASELERDDSSRITIREIRNRALPTK